jgi:hypothetical protein
MEDSEASLLVLHLRSQLSGTQGRNAQPTIQRRGGADDGLSDARETVASKEKARIAGLLIAPFATRLTLNDNACLPSWHYDTIKTARFWNDDYSGTCSPILVKLVLPAHALVARVPRQGLALPRAEPHHLAILTSHQRLPLGLKLHALHPIALIPATTQGSRDLGRCH